MFGRWESGRESVTRELYRGHGWRSQMAVSPMGITNGPASFEIRERGCVVVSPKASRAFYTPDWRQTNIGRPSVRNCLLSHKNRTKTCPTAVPIGRSATNGQPTAHAQRAALTTHPSRRVRHRRCYGKRRLRGQPCASQSLPRNLPNPPQTSTRTTIAHPQNPCFMSQKFVVYRPCGRRSSRVQTTPSHRRYPAPPAAAAQHMSRPRRHAGPTSLCLRRCAKARSHDPIVLSWTSPFDCCAF